MGFLQPQRSQPPPLSRREQSRRAIRRLEARAVRGLYALALFLFISLLAGRGFDLLPPLAANIRALLGPAPPPSLISLALVVYSFSAAVLILSRMAVSEKKPAAGFTHVGYLSAFYLFYHFADAMSGNFWAVLAAGSMILCLQSYHLWTHCAELLREERETLARIERTEKFAAGNSTSTEKTEN